MKIKKFNSWDFFNYHLTFYQDLQCMNFQLSICVDNDFEHNCRISLFILFWGVDYSWNGRLNPIMEKTEKCIKCGGNDNSAGSYHCGECIDNSLH